MTEFGFEWLTVEVLCEMVSGRTK